MNVALVPLQNPLLTGCVVITGSCTSFTLTVKEQVATPQAEVAVTVTVVKPTGNVLPDGIEYVTVGAGVPVTVAA